MKGAIQVGRTVNEKQCFIQVLKTVQYRFEEQSDGYTPCTGNIELKEICGRTEPAWREKLVRSKQPFA
jgi:hypothetical protein